MAKPTIGCKTTVDTVHQRYTTTPTNGIKRPYDKISLGSADTVLRDITNHATPKRQVHLDLARNRFAASSIVDLSSDLHDQPQTLHGTASTSALPGPSQNPLLSLSHPRYALPQSVVQNFAGLGIRCIYPWQSSCLLGRGLLEGEKNLVYTAPTGGGKSLVADVLMLKRVIEDPAKKAILVLPYVALVQEKVKWLRKIVEGVRNNALGPNQAEPNMPKWRRRHDSSVRVVGFFGGSKAKTNWLDIDIAVCTIEKVNETLFEYLI